MISIFGRLTARLFAPGINLINQINFRSRIIGALMLREVHTRYGRENIGALWLVGEPFFFTLAVVLLWSTVRSPYDQGIPVVAFVITGYVPLTMWRHAITRSMNSYQANASLLYHRQIGLLDILNARVLLEVYGAIMAYFIVASIFYFLGQYEFPVDYGLFYLGWLYMILFSGGLALILSCLSEVFEWMEKIISPGTYIMVPLSGCFYIVEWLPEPAREMALYLPSVHAYELMRSGQFGPSFNAHYDIFYVTFVCSVLIAIGLALTTSVRQYLVVE